MVQQIKRKSIQDAKKKKKVYNAVVFFMKQSKLLKNMEYKK
jgi:hypothetical protein